MATNLENEALIRRYWSEIWNDGSTDAVAELYHPECRHYGAFTIAGFQRNVSRSFEGMPDLRAEVLEILSVDDTVVTRVIYRATHTGNYFGIEATGRTIEITGMDLFRIRDGRIVEHWHEADHAAMFEQLGMEWKPIADGGAQA
ncbi:MAG TPA: ester cyclase [Candidatus Kapabacteria bacterium]|jgi:steroid delta-isomerase-like uncharacterized protein|nr:ester cyclase [Candidatus Kapabacteria bacterium]